MGKTAMLYSDISGDVFKSGEGAEVRIKIGEGADAKHYTLDVTAEEAAHIVNDENGEPRVEESKPRGRKPASDSASPPAAAEAKKAA
jgi:hypothetical protein